MKCNAIVNARFSSLVVYCLLSQSVPSSAAELKLAGVFADHAVLQRDRPVPVWGWTNTGEEVVVEFAGQKKTAKATADGKWIVQLDPLAASAEPRDLQAGGSCNS